jgi:DNA repair exonuclease SbcCD ATPase subunit
MLCSPQVGVAFNEQQARAEKAEAELAEAKVERETIAQSSLRSLESYIDKLKQFAERAERAEAEIAEWSVLNLWGGTPEIVHEFIKGQQARIHRCQDLEADNAKWQKLLLMSRDDREIDLISEIEEQARLLGMSGEREADLSGKLGRLESELAAEREKVRVLREALEKYQHTVIAGGTNPARDALTATEDSP